MSDPFPYQRKKGGLRIGSALIDNGLKRQEKSGIRSQIRVKIERRIKIRSRISSTEVSYSETFEPDNQVCGTLMIYFGSGSDFGKVFVPVPVSTLVPVMALVPIPDTEI
jgi:hypothetical protein